MTAYEVGRFCRTCLHDKAFRTLARTDPGAALEGFGLTTAERDALLDGQVGDLYSICASAFLLSYLPRWGIVGLDVATYSERMRTSADPPHTIGKL